MRVRQLKVGLVLVGVGCAVALWWLSAVDGNEGLPELVIAPDDELVTDRWMAGYHEGRVVASMHVREVEHTDGSQTQDSMVQMRMQSQGDAGTIVIHHRWQVAHDGAMQGFQFFEKSFGVRTSAAGTIGDEWVEGVVERNGNHHVVKLPVDDQVLAFPDADARQARIDHRDSTPLIIDMVELDDGMLQFSRSSESFLEVREDGTVVFETRFEDSPGIVSTTVEKVDGTLISSRLAIGSFIIDYLPAEGPVPLGTIDLHSMASHGGTAPGHAMVHRYRLAVQGLPEDAFQYYDQNLLVVSAVPRSHPPTDPGPLLQAAPLMEVEDPQLGEWVAACCAGLPDRPEDLARALSSAVGDRLAVATDLGDLSAKEAWVAERGDCSEHARLLTTACRIAGIPARCDVGMVYNAANGGWSGHAWVTVWDAKQARWFHLDPSYAGLLRSCYIRTGSRGPGSDDMYALLGSRIELVD